MKKRRIFSAEMKAEAVLQLISGEKSSAELCREHKVSSQQLGNWKKQFLANADLVFETSKQNSEEEERIADLERMVGKLTMQLEIAERKAPLAGKKPQASWARLRAETVACDGLSIYP